MVNYVGKIEKVLLLQILMPWKSFTRASPLLWVFLVAVLMFFLGINFKFLEVFTWIGGFLSLFFVAVAVSLFENL